MKTINAKATITAALCAVLLVATSCGSATSLDEPQVAVRVIDDALLKPANANTPEADGLTGNEPADGTDISQEDSSADDLGSVADDTSDPPTGVQETGDGSPPELATSITLTSADAEMNTQPDDKEWGLLKVSNAYTTDIEGALVSTALTKLVVIGVEITMVVSGNVFDQAFRLEAEGEWYSPIADELVSGSTGEVVNADLVFEVPRSATTVTLEGGLPEALGTGRRATYDLTFTPGSLPEQTPIPDGEIDAVATEIVLIEGAGDISTQPDDKEWGLLKISKATTTALTQDVTATPSTKLVVFEVEITMGTIGNVFSDAFRLRADEEWYSPVFDDLSGSASTGEVLNATIIFEIPRSASDLELEAGFPRAISHYEWDFPLKTSNYEIVFN